MDFLTNHSLCDESLQQLAQELPPPAFTASRSNAYISPDLVTPSLTAAVPPAAYTLPTSASSDAYTLSTSASSDAFTASLSAFDALAVHCSLPVTPPAHPPCPLLQAPPH